MSKIRIMVVDDMALLRQMLVRRLSAERDFEVIAEAAHGREAVELAVRKRPDVILMDLEMPLLNGTEATRRILVQQPYVKIILLTQLSQLSNLAPLSGATAFLDKECSPE